MPRLLLPLLAILLTASSAWARPPHKQAIIDLLGPALPPNLADCVLCHVPGKPDEDRPHNAFGARLDEIRGELKKAGKPIDIISRFKAVADEDADRDGVSNLLEVLAGRNPGVKDDVPTEAELTAARPKQTGVFAAKGGYEWKPFEPVVRPTVPVVKNAGWVRNPIDAFVAAEHQRRRIVPRPEASRAILLRRVTLDLTGLPPTREQLADFIADPSTDAYEKAVDRLLGSPEYGERWGRHWMDVWRYADWAGYGAEVRESQPHIWRWRDWIVESLNRDKPYDRMVREMLAADEIDPTDEDALRATGYLVRSWYKFSKVVWLDNVVEHAGKAFLGLTLNCAKCHDHFFDPITQQEHYAFRALFEPYDIRTDRVPGTSDTTKAGLVRVFDARPNEPTYLFIRGNDLTPDKSKPIPPAVPALLGGHLDIKPVARPMEAQYPDRRPFVIEALRADAIAAVEKAHADFALARQAAAKKGPGRLFAAEVVVAELTAATAEAKRVALEAELEAERREAEPDGQKSDAWKSAALATFTAQKRAAVLDARRAVWVARAAFDKTKEAEPARAAAKTKLDAAEKALATAEQAANQPPTTTFTRRPQVTYPSTSTGRRLALAQWLTEPRNPLTARVAVNHIWLRHFGRGLVPTMFDFGKNGRPPSHPALLDWLAAEFMAHGWSMKELHRLMVTSATYRMDSTPDSRMLAADPENAALWRFAPRRIEAEAVRDAVLALAGTLDRTMGGPDIDHKLGLTVPRRSLYFRHGAEKQVEFLTVFDAANVTECYRRDESIIPQQALALANSTLTLGQSRLLTRKLHGSLPPSALSPGSFTDLAFETILGRPPVAAERDECEQFLTKQAELLADPKRLNKFVGPSAAVPPSTDPMMRAREDLVHVLLNHHEFVTIR